MSFCVQCGASLPAESRYCPDCGHSVPSDSEAATLESTPARAASPPGLPSPSPSAATPGPEPSKRADVPTKRLSGCALAAIVGGGGLVVLLVGLIALFVFASSVGSGAADAVDEHLDLLRQGEVERAYEGTSKAFRATIDLDGYRRFLESHPVLSEAVATSFNVREVEGGEATLKGSLTTSSGKVTALHCGLFEEDGVWKIHSIELPEQAPAAAETSVEAPLQPPGLNLSGVGRIVVGAGRNDDGSLVGPGEPIPSGVSTISADIELIDHREGERVQVWVEREGVGTEPIDATIEGAGSGFIPYDLTLGQAAFPPGRYAIVVLVDGMKRFTQEFEIR